MTSRAAKRVSIGLVSDTHSWLDPFILEAFAGLDHIVHAGDIGTEAVLEELRGVAPLCVIRGNIDGGDLRYYEEEEVLVAGGKRIGVRHICGNPFRPNPAAKAFIRRERLDVLVCGHSHIPVIQEVQGALWINPGAAGKHGFHTSRTAAILHIENGEFSMDRVNLEPRWPKAKGSPPKT
ncbi:MAG: putative phosphoesterase [Bradymonadia bacterium]